MWVRGCARCKQTLAKQHLSQIIRCICGWVWGD